MRLAAIAILGLACCATNAGGAVTTGSLIDEMTDLHRLSRRPSPSFKTIQFSSYDRTSSSPGGEGWFANSDGFGGEPSPNFEGVITLAEKDGVGEYVMCDVEGPGAIVRTWTAQIRGTLRVYLDNNETPLYDGPAEEFLLHPYDRFLGGSGLTAADLADTFYQRNAAYAPIPFAKRCRIVWVGNHRDTHFYEVQMRIYEKGTEVTTFSAGDLVANAVRIRTTAAVLSDPDSNLPFRSTRTPLVIQANVPANAKTEALKLNGPGAIERLVLKVDAPDIDRALRQTILYIHCDGAPWGQVQSPIGDFFGAGPGVNPYRSLPFNVMPDGTMTCRFVMPYKTSLRILFQNRGDQDVTVSGSVLSTDDAWDDASSMHFRARWRVDHDLVASSHQMTGVQDLPFLIARGGGVYVGTAVMLLNPSTVPTSWGNWWGEGDEKIFVDDDVRPSIFGTGSEDYFNYAWSANDIFAFPYCGQPRNDGPANRGNVVNFRWHIVDPLPFQQGIAFYMELLSHEKTPGYTYARIGYHYAAPGLVDDHMPITNEDVRMPQLPPTWEPSARFGANKFKFIVCENVVKSKSNTTLEEGGLWQGGRVMVWTPPKAGDTLEFEIEVPEPGEYTLMTACMVRPGGGAFRLAVDGIAVPLEGKDSVTLDGPHHVQSRIMGGHLKGLAAGTHIIAITANEASRPIGLDFFGYQKR